MRITACLDPATEYQRYADDADVSSGIGKPVKVENGKIIGHVMRTWVESGSLMAEIELDEPVPGI